MTAMTPEQFALDELGLLGITPTSGDVGVIEAWEAQEGGNWHNDATGNPLNTTLPYGESTAINSVGVQAYRSWHDGEIATEKTLVSTSGHPYDGILAALAQNNPAAAAQAIVDSPWGTKTITYDGHTYARGTTPTSSSSSGSSSTSGATDVGLFGAHGWNPLAWPGQILDAGVSGVWDQVQPFLVTAMFAVGAIGLVVIGGKQLVQPTVDRVEESVQQGAQAASAIGKTGGA